MTWSYGSRALCLVFNPKKKKLFGFGVTHNKVKQSVFWDLSY
jgi:hypothetical protein